MTITPYPSKAAPTRRLYIAAYDIRHPKRLRRALHLLKEQASGRQKSVFEVFLTEPEKERLLERVAEVLNPDEDRFFLLRLSDHQAMLTAGIAVPPLDQQYICIE